MLTFAERRCQEESVGRDQINEEKVKLGDARAEAMKSARTIVEEGVARIDRAKAESNLEVRGLSVGR